MKEARPLVGVILPTYASGGKQVGAAELHDLAQSAEGLGFDSVWVIDHFVRAPTHAQTFLEPMAALAFIAAVTTRVKVGPNILVAPVRHPVLLAKSVATLEHLSDGRLILGLGTGWNQLEFDAVGIPKAERGPRFDELMEALRLLLSNRAAGYQGRFYRFPELAIDPPVAREIPIWIGGGSQPNMIGSSEPHPVVGQRVIDRIARSNGWLAPITASPEMMAADWARVRASALAAKRDPDSIVFAKVNFFHIVDTEDRDQAYDEQRSVFRDLNSERRPWSYTTASYLVGSISDLVSRLQAALDVGVTYLTLGPATADPREGERQLELLVRRVLPQVRLGEDSMAVRP